MAKKEFPEWAKTLYRGLRAGVSAGLLAVWALKPDLEHPQEFAQIVAITFGTAFLVAFGKWFRERLDAWFGVDEKSIVAKVMPF